MFRAVVTWAILREMRPNRLSDGEERPTAKRSLCLRSKRVSGAKMKTRMARRRTTPEADLERVLARAKDLAQEVRQTAERVHREADEAHRLIEIARHEAEKGRELSKTTLREVNSVRASIEGSFNNTGNGVRRRPDKDQS
jgi:hypothetical protein